MADSKTPEPEKPADSPEPKEHHDPKPETESGKKSRTPGKHHLERFKNWYGGHKKWAIPATVFLVILLLVVIPWSRYKICGLFIKKNFTVVVIDSATNRPVSGAKVSMLQQTVESDNNGKATLKDVKVGEHSMLVAKKYFHDNMTEGLVPIVKQKSPMTVQLKATGRQVKVTVIDLISKKPVANAEVSAADTSAKTDKNGVALIVLPPGGAEQKATLKRAGYNDTAVTLKVSDSSIAENQVPMTPAGKIYFLSKLSGKIDVVKTNLDGAERQTVLAGTGHEDDQNTVLLASRDWKYLALLSRRAGNSATLYLIKTSDDSLSTIDEGNATFSLVGWSDDTFVYTINRNAVQLWQPHKEALKSYDAANNKLQTLDQTGGEGSAGYDYLSETYGQVYEIAKNIIYNKAWNYGYTVDGSQLAQKNDAIYSISPNGSNLQTLKTFTAGANYLNSVLYQASQIYYQEYTNGSGGNTYYIYQNGKVTQSSKDLTDEFNEYQQNPITYLQSPSGNQTFWSEPRDGKNTLFLGDQDGQNGKQIATLSDYNTYGWYTDNYLLVSKNKSELYAISPSGIKQDSEAIKITDYHKPVQNFYGYGGGYGGI